MKIVKFALLSLFLSTANFAHATLIEDTHEIVIIAPETSSVDYTFFSVTVAGNFDLSATNTSGSLDTYIRLFEDDGSDMFGAQLAFNDDGGPGLNSLISNFFLDVGNYVLAMGDFFLEEEAARTGINVDDSSPEFGTADIVISSQNGTARAVSEPSMIALLGIAFAGALVRRKARK